MNWASHGFARPPGLSYDVKNNGEPHSAKLLVEMVACGASIRAEQEDTSGALVERPRVAVRLAVRDRVTETRSNDIAICALEAQRCPATTLIA
mmetsp:Transcript_5895/g.13977  ORF Transcript_5895/g.13977 Transcript_5895/m.13977 type:complete len:93 (-) Transcript_5895:7-285(-)